MSDLARFSVEREGDVHRGTLIGEIDLSNAEHLERAVEDAVPNTSFGMLLDLSGVTYIDSAGVRFLLTVADRFRWRGQGLALIAPPDARVRRVLALAGAERALIVDETVEAAKRRMENERP